MTEFTIELKSGEKPLYEQIYQYIADGILCGRIGEGERLPGKRALAKHLSVSVVTVETAYSILAAEGFLRPEARRGFYACRVDSRPEAKEGAPHADEPKKTEAPPRFAFSTSEVDVSLFPYKLWAKLNREVLTGERGLLSRGDGMGDYDLRETLCDFLNAYRGVRLRPGQLLIGAGTEYLLSVLVRLLSGDMFALEDPGYRATYRAIERSGGKIAPIPLDGQGMSISALASSGANVAYVTPSHQFPLGITMPAGRRVELLNWAELKENRFIVEDDYDSEFRHNIRPIPAMQGYDHSGKVIYAGTFSRSLAPSIRIAYLALPDALLARYRQWFHTSASTVSRFEQQVLKRFIATGAYARHLRRAGIAYKQRSQALIQALSPVEGLSLSGEGAGLHFLATIPRLSEPALIERAREQGALVHGLSEYRHAANVQKSTIVLGYAGLSEDAMNKAGAALSRAWSLNY